MRLDLSAWITLPIQKHSAGAYSSVCTWVIWRIKASISYEKTQKGVCYVDFRTVCIQGLREWKLPKKKGYARSSVARWLYLAVARALWRGCGAALWPGFQRAHLSVTGSGRWLCFTLPFGFLSDALSCVLQWHVPFGSFFLQVYLIVPPQTTVATHSGGGAWRHECAAWCKLTAASHWTWAGRKQLSVSRLLLAKQCVKMHKRGSIQNDTLKYILETTGGIVADVIQRLLMQVCFAKELLLTFTVTEGTWVVCLIYV